MIHHSENDPNCPACEAKLSTTHPDLASWFRALVKPLFPTAHVSWAYRDKLEQEQAFSEGKSKCHYPFSAHNKMNAGKPESLALDLFQQIDGIGSWPHQFFARINQFNVSQKLSVKWGGQFKSLGDADHFQIIFPE